MCTVRALTADGREADHADAGVSTLGDVKSFSSLAASLARRKNFAFEFGQFGLQQTDVIGLRCRVSEMHRNSV